MDMIDRVANAIDSVQLFVRFNDWGSDKVDGSPIEICRYGKDGEGDIVVVRRFSGAKKESDALYETVSEERARAAVEAMREPYVEMIAAFWRQKNNGTQETGEKSSETSDYDAYRAMIDKALGK